MRLLKPFQYKDSWLAFFILGIIMLNFPFLVICNKTTTLFGIPLLIFYFFTGWPISIWVIYLFSRHIGLDQEDGDDDRGEAP